GNRLDHADRRQRQRTRKVAREIDDLAALDAGRRFDLVARDDRARIGGNHFYRDAEVRQLFLDQAAGEFQRLDADGFLRFRRLVQQRQRRQVGIRQIVEQRRLFLFLDTLGFRYRDNLRFDADRLRL